MIVHDLISIAVPTRHKPGCISKFIETFDKNTRTDGRPHLTILYDSPEKPSRPTCNYDGPLQEVTIFEKKGLTSLYNMGIILSPTDWVMVCNDDISFNEGWLEYLEKKIEEGNHLAIHLFHYGAVLLHKSLMLKIGWFDERFNFGGYEDFDYQVRSDEAGLKDKFDMSHDFIKRVGGVEVGHFINHHKIEVATLEGWVGDNSIWMREKWGTQNFRPPFVRQHGEIDWYPKYTQIYCKKFNMSCEWKATTLDSIANKKEIFN